VEWDVEAVGQVRLRVAPGSTGRAAGMTSPDEDLLTTAEGVDEGSAASTAEDSTSGSAAVDAGPGGRPSPESEATPAPPVDMESSDSRAARSAAGPGQQVEAGEG
jgi:hypothetical protein